MIKRNSKQERLHGLVVGKAKAENIQALTPAEIGRVFGETVQPELCERVFRRLVAAGLTLHMIERMELPPPAAGRLVTSPNGRIRAIASSRRVYVLAPGGDYNDRPRMEARQRVDDPNIHFVYNHQEETTTIIETR